VLLPGAAAGKTKVQEQKTLVYLPGALIWPAAKAKVVYGT